MSFVRSANPIWLMVDLTGKILDDTYYISYLTNTLPYLPQFVFRDNQGLIPWTDPVQFLANGTLPDNIYFDPNLVYRLEVRKGPLQSDPLIYEINDFVPGDGGSVNPNSVGDQENQISNPQFSQVNFGLIPGGASTPSLVLNTSGTYEIAPDWFLTLTGSGTCTITQLILSGDQNLANSPTPPYALRIVTTGWTSAILYQRFSGNGDIWANTFVSMSVLARSSNSVANPITLVYNPNSPGTPIQITNQNLNVGPFSIIQGVIALPTSTNTTLNNAAYVDMQIVLPSNGSVDLSNVQVMGQIQQLPIDFAQVPEETIERQIDHLFNYYQPQLFYRQIPSYLTGWDFSLNPAQINGSTVGAQAIGANKSFYAWDQTIIFQSVNSGVTVNRFASGAMQVVAASTGQFAVIQYLDFKQAMKIANQRISVNIAAINTAASTGVTVSLWYTTGLLPNINPTVGTNNSLVATLDANGKPATFNGTWVEIKRDNLQNAYTNIVSSQNFEDYSFNGWNLNNITTDETISFVAIVIGTAPITSTNSLILDSISMCAGDIPSRPAPQTPDQVLRECQAYYEKSYATNVVAGSVSNLGLRCHTFLNSGNSTGTFYQMFSQTWGFTYLQTKRVVPQLTFWTPAGLINNIQVGMILGTTYFSPDSQPTGNPGVEPISHYGLVGQSRESVILAPTSTFLLFSFASTLYSISPYSYQGLIHYHYVADSRLGVA